MDLDVYKRRLGGTTSSEALFNASIEQTNQLFKDSPMFQVVKLNGVDTDSRVSLEKDSTERQLLLRPQTSVKKGVVATFEGEDWLVVNYIPNKVFPKAKVKLCNALLKWNDGVSTKEYPCVAKEKTVKLNEDDDFVVTSENEIEVSTPFNNDTKTIAIKQRFLIGSKTYEVIGIDDITNVVNNVGILKLILEVTNTSESDDTIVGVADNDTSNDGWGGGW